MSSSSSSNKIPDLESIPLPDDEQQQQPQLDEEQRQEELMKQMLGFTGFNSTKGKKVEGNDKIGKIRVVKKRKYRQYMNRKGGFNRPLDKVE